MHTRFLVLTVAVLSLGHGVVFAEEGPVFVDEGVPRGPALTCFKLEQPADACAIVDKPIVNYMAPRFNVVDLNGQWAANGVPGPYIYLYADAQYAAGYTLSVDMTLLSRPDAFGYVVNATQIAVVFPDDTDYTGTLESPTTIRWSNGTVWTKL